MTINPLDVAYQIVIWVYSTSQGLWEFMNNTVFWSEKTLWEIVKDPTTWIALLTAVIVIKLVGAFLP